MYTLSVIQPPTSLQQKYEDDRIGQSLENKSFLSMWVDPKTDAFWGELIFFFIYLFQSIAFS